MVLGKKGGYFGWGMVLNTVPRDGQKISCYVMIQYKFHEIQSIGYLVMAEDGKNC